MSRRADLDAAVAVFRDLGWAARGVTYVDAPTLPLGTPEQRAVARTGLASGAWGKQEKDWTWTSWIDVDESMLQLFAIRVGVEPRRAAALAPHPYRVGLDVLVAVFSENERRRPALTRALLARRFRRGLEHATSTHGDLIVHLVDAVDLDLDEVADLAGVEYAIDWLMHAGIALDLPRDRSEVSTRVHTEATVRRRFTEHVRLCVTLGAPVTGMFLPVLREGLRREWIGRDEALAEAFVGLESAGRPGDRKVWISTLTELLHVTEAELLAHADLLTGVLATGEGPVIEALAPPLIAGVPEADLPDLLQTCLLARTQKARRLVLQHALARVENISPAARAELAATLVSTLAPTLDDLAQGKDAALARLATRLLDALGAEPSPTQVEPTGAQGWWQATPPVWEVPRFEIGPVTEEGLADAIVAWQQQPGARGEAYERFLAVATQLAYADLATARRALGALNFGRPEVRDDSRLLKARMQQDPLTARFEVVSADLGELPCLLSTASWWDLRLDPSDLVARLQRYANEGVSVREPDLFLAVCRLDASLVSDDHRAELRGLQVPVVLPDGTIVRRRLRRVRGAGDIVLDYLADPVGEPEPDDARPGRSQLPHPSALDGFPHRISGGWWTPDPATFPTWQESTLECLITDVDFAELGSAMRQIVRRRTPFGPRGAINLLGAAREPHAQAAEDALTAVLEAWQRGLLRPGVPDVQRLGWRPPPTQLAAMARLLLEVAPDGLASLAWGVLDDLLVASTRASRLLAGTAEVAEAMQALLPEALAALDAGLEAGLATPEVLAVPGVRALAARAGTSRAVVVARAVVEGLPASASPLDEMAGAPAVDVDRVWVPIAGSGPAIGDGVHLTLVRHGDRPGVDLRLPGDPERAYRAVHVGYGDVDVVHHGSCYAWPYNAARMSGPPSLRFDDRVWLTWDPARGHVVVAKEAPRAGRTPLTPALVCPELLALAQPGARGREIQRGAENTVLALVREGHLGPATVAVVADFLLRLEHLDDVDPARIVHILDTDPAALSTLWPLLSSAVRLAGDLAVYDPSAMPPRWVARVLDMVAAHAPVLAEASRRGLLGEVSAPWAGLDALCALQGKTGTSAAATKARALHEILRRA